MFEGALMKLAGVGGLYTFILVWVVALINEGKRDQ